jgi:hypothetical protein
LIISSFNLLKDCGILNFSYLGFWFFFFLIENLVWLVYNLILYWLISNCTNNLKF